MRAGKKVPNRSEGEGSDGNEPTAGSESETENEAGEVGKATSAPGLTSKLPRPIRSS